jgi:hypothetical protein
MFENFVATICGSSSNIISDTTLFGANAAGHTLHATFVF